MAEENEGKESAMKLKNKLIISFLMIMAIPLFLFCVFSVVLVRYQFVIIQNSYGVSAELTDFFPNNNKLFSQLMNNVQLKLKDEVEENSGLLEDKEALEKCCEEEAGKFINVVVLKDSDIYYSYKPLQQEEIEAIQKESQDDTDEAESSGTVYLSQENTILGKAIDTKFADGSRAQIYTLVKVNQWLPELKQLVVQFILAMIFILFLTACIFTTWIYRSVVQPIRELRQATEKIKSGNLDFQVAVSSNDEMGQLCTDFEKMRQRLKESAEEKIRFDNENRELISNISHDLKTPITSIKGYVEGIMDGVADTPEKMERYLKTVYNKTNDMQRLIDELTFYSKIDTNRIPYNFRKINVSDYFGDCAEEVGLDLGAKNVVFQYANYVDENVMVIADPEQIRRVVNNIIGNSCKYFDKSQCFINMRIKDVGDFIQVEIEDNGKGIAAKDIPYIFDRFYRTDSSRNSSKGGSGIGLSIVRKIMEDHGGKVWASSKEGTGTVVYFVLRKYEENVQNVEKQGDGTDDSKSRDTRAKEEKTKDQKIKETKAAKENSTGKVVFAQETSAKNSTSRSTQMHGKERME